MDHRQLFADEGPSKFQRKQLEIVEAAIKCYDRLSIEGTHFGNVAEELGVTRPLIKHYFKDTEQLSLFAIKYIRLHLEQFVSEKTSPIDDPSKKFEAFINEVLAWPRKKKVHARVWCNFLQMCSRDKDHMAIHAEYVQASLGRIAAMLETINKKSHAVNVEKAKIVGIILSGAMTTVLSEPVPNPDSLADQVRELIWQITNN